MHRVPGLCTARVLHRLACLPTNQRGRLCIRTNSSEREKPKPGQIRVNRGRFVWPPPNGSRGYCRFCPSILVASVSGKVFPLDVRDADSIASNSWDTKFRNNNRLLVILSWSNFIDVFFKVSNKGTKFISCRSMEYCAGTYFTESPVQTENLAGCNEQVWTTGVDIYIYIKLRWRLKMHSEIRECLPFQCICEIPRRVISRRNTAVHSIRSDHQRSRERVKILGQFRNRNG